MKFAARAEDELLGIAELRTKLDANMSNLKSVVQQGFSELTSGRMEIVFDDQDSDSDGEG